MCGLAGYYGQGNREILKKMTGSLSYRGPDDEGFFVQNKIGLGHQRLAIVDLSEKGRQPLSNEDETIHLIFNGEIYNYKDLKKGLMALGHRFKSQTDTEVIVHQYEENGLDCFKKFNGMFALAIWDSQKKRLILARDHYGQKPLYWSKIDNSLIFASELKAILFHPLIKRKLNHLAVYQYFSFDYVPQPFTIFKNIYKLENGSFLVFENNKIALDKYYQIEASQEEINFQSALVSLEELLEDSIKKHLLADVPLGIFLSGGLDSSTIAYFAKKQKKDIETFSIGFSEPSFDESFYAQQVAKYLKTKHYHQEFKPKDCLAIIPKVIEDLDEPFGDPSILPTYLLAKFTRQRVKVALAGDGGDELLMGYPNHQVQKAIFFLKLDNLKFNSQPFGILQSVIPVSEKNLALSYKIKRYLSSLDFPPLYRDFLNIGGYFNQIEQLFNFQIKPEEIFNFADCFLKDYQTKDYLSKVNLLFLKYYLPDDILFKADRASMYNSLEVRAPFLDFRLADFINSLPLDYKLKKLKTKYILKKLMENKLPQNIINRRKKGFGLPLTGWLKRELKNYMIENLSQSEIDKFGLINYRTAAKLIKDHLENKADNRKIIWNLIIFQNWAKKYLSWPFF